MIDVLKSVVHGFSFGVGLILANAAMTYLFEISFLKG